LSTETAGDNQQTEENLDSEGGEGGENIDSYLPASTQNDLKTIEWLELMPEDTINLGTRRGSRQVEAKPLFIYWIRGPNNCDGLKD